MPQDDQEESIYNLIAPPRQVRARSSMHKSRYPHDTPPTASTFVTQRFARCNISNVAGNYRPAQPNTPSNYLYGHPDVSTLPPSPHKRAAQVLSAPRPCTYHCRVPTMLFVYGFACMSALCVPVSPVESWIRAARCTSVAWNSVCSPGACVIFCNDTCLTPGLLCLELLSAFSV